MTDGERDALNQALAAALAPVVGETTVYELKEIYHCAEHGPFSSPFEIRVDGRLYCKRCLRSLSVTDERWPKDLADPAVGWPVWERWAEDSLTDLQLTIFSDGWCATLSDGQDIWESHAPGETAWAAILAAWAEALGVEGGSGDD